jgi:hypothetical protein
VSKYGDFDPFSSRNPPSEWGFFSPKKILARSPNSFVFVCQISLEKKERCKSQKLQ